MRKPLKILVTGGAGYIGSHVVQRLCDDGHEVVVFDHFSLGRVENVDRRAEVVGGDVCSAADLERAFTTHGGIGAVFHFAALKAVGDSMINPTEYARNNLGGSLQLIAAAVRHGVERFVFSSSAAVYGRPRFIPMDETHPKEPVNYYGYTKLAIEENLRWFSMRHGLRYAALRYFNATGYDLSGRIMERERRPANLCPIIMEVVAGTRGRLQVYGNGYATPDGTGVRDYIHVDDLVSAHVSAMDYLAEEERDLVVNLGTGRGYSVLEMIAAAEAATGRAVAYEIVEPRPGDPATLVASSSLAHQLLGWKAEHSDLQTIFGSMVPVYFSRTEELR